MSNRPDDPLKSSGNLTYLEFVTLVKEMWESVNPDIPIVPTQGKNFAQYPCISYGLEYRKTVANESKPKIRPQFLSPEYNDQIIRGQRYENYVSFMVHTEADPYLADSIIEMFEDFMQEYIGVFKELGLSEILYARRLSDRESNRESVDICVRTVAYLVTTEKVTVKKYDLISKVIADARLFLEHNRIENATPDFSAVEINIVDTEADATPQY